MNTTYCDNCGEPQKEKEMYHYQHLPKDTTSALCGESGSLCSECNAEIEKG